MLQATLTTFPEATVVRSAPLAMEVVFTTPVGFRDQVEFRIDPQAQRVDFRSRSLFGLFDWGKNRSRMQEFKNRFEQLERWARASRGLASAADRLAVNKAPAW